MIVKSEPPALPKCVNKDGSEVTLSADMMRGEGGAEGFSGLGENGLVICSGPKPLMPVPVGCTGPICKNGRWEFACPQGERIAPPMPGMMPPTGTEQPTAPTTVQIREGVACTQEWSPVCGTNGRTYPNACFAKADNMIVAKAGACEGQTGQTNTGGTVPPEGYPQPYPEYYPPPADSSYPSGDQYQQFAPPPAEIAPPQTRRSPSDIFFATILEAFTNLLPR